MADGDKKATVDYVFEMENLQFDDGYGRTGLEINVDDLDFDFEVDNAELLGDITGNVFSTTSSDLQALVPDWVVQEEGSAAAALQELFDSDNFFDGGDGTDAISAGGGDDTIDPGAKSGDANDVVDGGEGMDVVILSGNAANWTKAVAGAGHTGKFDVNGDGDTTGDDATDDLSKYDKYTCLLYTSDAADE